jgi:hypothetical protein
MINDTNQLFNSARKRGAKAKSDEEPSALKLQEVVTGLSMNSSSTLLTEVHSMPSRNQKDDISQPEHSSYPYNNPHQAGQDSVEPATQVATNQAQPVPIDSFMPMNEFARPITTLTEHSQITRLVEGTLQRFGIQPDGALTLYGVPFQ